MGQYLIFENDGELKKFLINTIKVDPRSINYFTRKNKILFFYFERIQNKLCNIIKQDMISAGGDAAVSRDVARFKDGRSNLLLMATQKQFRIFIEKSAYQPPSIKEIGEKINGFLNNLNTQKLNLKIKDRVLNCSNKIYLMGVINVTPDSFYEGSRSYSFESAAGLAERMTKADIIDIGGESSRPGAEKISAREEINRVLPLVKFIKKKFKVIVSVDTYKSETAKAALSEGADMINDISGLKFDKKMAGIIAQYKASVVLMHIKGTPKTMQKNPQYSNLMGEIKDYLAESIKIALDNSIQFDKIIIDPGIGFGKTAEHNCLILKKLNELKVLNRPILIGLSRKSLIGKILKNEPDKRLNGSIVLNTLSILNGANIVRVHDIQEHREMVKLLEFYYKV